MATPLTPSIDFATEDIGEVATKNPERIFANRDRIARWFGEAVAVGAVMLATRSRIELENCLNFTGC